MGTAISEQPLDTAGAVDIAQAALRLGISMQTLVTLLEHGFLKGFKGEDGRWKVLLEAAEAAAALAAALPVTEPRANQPLRPPPPAAAAAPEPPPQQPPLAAAASRPAMQAVPPPAPDVQPEEPPMLRQPAPSVAEPESPRAPPAAEAPRPLPAAEPPPPQATVAEKLLADQVDYLKAQLDRRDQTIVDKDALIAELMQSLARLGRTAIKRIGGGAGDDDLQAEFERSRRQQAEVNERHERVLHGVSDVLASVRNHLARQRPTGTDNN